MWSISSSSKVNSFLQFGQTLFLFELSVTPRTFEGIFRNYKLHIEPIVGNMKTYKLDTMTIQKVVNRMLENGCSVAVAKKIKFFFNQFCEYAIDSKWILVNPTHKIKIRARARDRRCLMTYLMKKLNAKYTNLKNCKNANAGEKKKILRCRKYVT